MTDRMNIKISTNETITGKQVHKLGNDHWQTGLMDVAQITVWNYVNGKAIAPGVFDDKPLTGDEKTHKNNAHWTGCQLLVKDIDTGNHSRETLLANQYIKTHCAAIYPSSSYTPENKKWHLLFVLDTEISNQEHYKSIYSHVAEQIPFEVDNALKTVSQAVCGTGFTASEMSSHVKTLTDGMAYVNTQAAMIETQPTIDQYEIDKSKAEQLAAMRRKEFATANPDIDSSEFDGLLSLALVRDVESALSSLGIDTSKVNSTGYTVKPIACPVKSHQHDDKKPAFYYNPDKKHGSCFKCGDGTFTINKLADSLGIDRKAYNKKLSRTNKHKISVSKKAPFGAPEKLPDSVEFKSDYTVYSRYITSVKLPDTDVLIKSAMNTGKTEWIKTQIKEFERVLGYQPTVLVLTHLQSLADNIADRLGIENYQWLPDGMVSKATQIVCSYNSIHKLNPTNKFDLIFIDETTLFLGHGFGATMKSRVAYAYPILKKLLSNAGKVALLDAHMSNDVTDWLRTIRPHVTAVQNTYKHSWGVLQLYSRQDAVIAEFLAEIEKDNGTVVLTSNSAELTRKLQRIATDRFGDKGLHIWRKTSRHSNVQAVIEDFDNQLPKYRWLICSPSVATGVNITTPVNAVFGIFTHQNSGISVSCMVQMIGRFRNVKRRAVWVQNTIIKNPLPTDWKKIYQADVDKIVRNADVGNFANHGISELTPENIELLQLRAKMQAAKNKQANNQFAAFCKLATNEGYELQFIDTPGNDALREQLKAVKEVLGIETKELVLNSTAIDRETWNRFNSECKLTPEIDAGFERWKIESCTGQTITSDSYDLFHKPQDRKSLYRFNAIFDSLDTVQRRDRQQAKEQVFNTHRRYEVVIRKVVITGMKAVFGKTMLKSTDVLTADEISERLQGWIQTHLTDVQLFIDRRIDLSTKSISVLRRILNKVGMKLSYARSRLDGKRIYQYWIDRKHLAIWYQFSVFSRQFALTGMLAQNTYIDISIRVLGHNADGNGKSAQQTPLFIPDGKIIPPEKELAAYGD